MIKMYGNKTIRLVNLMEIEDTRKALNNSLSFYPLYKAKKDYDLIPTREELNEKILNHYKYHEIGAETIGRFLDELKITMSEIMPRYNELFKTVEIMADLPNPFDNVDVIETVEEVREIANKTEGNTTTAGTSESSGVSDTTSMDTSESAGNEKAENDRSKQTRFSDTPQNNVNDIGDYLTNFTDEKETNETSVNRSDSVESSHSENNETTTQTETNETGKSVVEGETSERFHHTYTKKGNQGVNTYAHDMNEFRTSIIDVVEQIINDKRLASLFLLVW